MLTQSKCYCVGFETCTECNYCTKTTNLCNNVMESESVWFQVEFWKSMSFTITVFLNRSFVSIWTATRGQFKLLRFPRISFLYFYTMCGQCFCWFWEKDWVFEGWMCRFHIFAFVFVFLNHCSIKSNHIFRSDRLHFYLLLPCWGEWMNEINDIIRLVDTFINYKNNWWLEP